MTSHRTLTAAYNREREDGYHGSHTTDDYRKSPPRRAGDHDPDDHSRHQYIRETKDADDHSRRRKDRSTGGYGEDDHREKK